MADLPGEIARSVRQLDTLWQHYRTEATRVDMRKFRRVALKKWSVWAHICAYADRRRNNASTRVAFVMLPRGKTLGADISAAILQTYRNPDVPETLVEHLVVVCTKASKKVKNAYDESGCVFWEILLYEELAFNKMACARVPEYTPLLTDAERAVAHKELGIEGPKEYAKVSRILHRVHPIGRLLGLREGDLVRVVSSDIMTMERTCYRHVVAENV